MKTTLALLLVVVAGIAAAVLSLVGAAVATLGMIVWPVVAVIVGRLR